MTRVIAFFNQKGGTAKTTSTLNVAAGLAELDRRVLMVDLDPQASLTMASGIDVQNLEWSSYDLLVDEAVSIRQVVKPTAMSGLEIAPSHPDLAAAELELLSVLERERQLSNKLNASDLSRWDYLLIDAPPALNIISVNILVAASELIIPIEPHPLSLMVLKRLFETIAKIRRLNPRLKVVGFLPTKVQRTSRLAVDMMATLDEEFPDLELLPAIPLSVKSAESIVERTSVLHYTPKSPVANAYREVAVWIDRDFEPSPPPLFLQSTEEVAAHV